MITHNDEKLGEIIAALKEKGVYENTIIIYSGDNGLAVGQHGLFGKQNLYEHSTKVPLIIYGKGISANQKSEAFVYLTDLYPTICELAGIPVPTSVNGRSFYDLFSTSGDFHHEFIVTTYKSYQRAIRDKRYKLIKYHVNDIRHTQLFDLVNDPFEISNLSENIEYADERMKLDQKLTEQLKLLNDTIWID
jgi:arylsulfatase A-like enzyme